MDDFEKLLEIMRRHGAVYAEVELPEKGQFKVQLGPPPVDEEPAELPEEEGPISRLPKHYQELAKHY